MSQENVEIAQAAREAFAKSSRAKWNEIHHPDAEYVPAPKWPDGVPLTGSDAIWDYYHQAQEPWEVGTYEYVEIIDDADWVLANQQRLLRGRASGVEVEFSYWVLFTIEDGLIREHRWFDSKAEALEAVGLAE